MLTAVQKAAREEALKHLNAGRPVFGYRNGEPVWIQPRMKRTCSNCGHVDRSEREPVSCPNCHFEEDSVIAPNTRKMNRAERRAQNRAVAKRERELNKELAKLPKPVAG